MENVKLEVTGNKVLVTYESGYWEQYNVANVPMPKFEQELEEVEREFTSNGYSVEWVV